MFPLYTGRSSMARESKEYSKADQQDLGRYRSSCHFSIKKIHTLEDNKYEYK